MDGQTFYEIVFLMSLSRIVLILANSADPDTTFHQGLHCLLVLPKYLYTGIYMFKCRIIAHSFFLLPHDAESGSDITPLN